MPCFRILECLRRVLIERFGFQTCFLITAGVKTASFVPLVCLLCVLREDLPARQGPGKEAAEEGAAVDALQQPLLANGTERQADERPEAQR
jgi:hypothetical protein